MSLSPSKPPNSPIIICLLPGPAGQQNWLQRDVALLTNVYVLKGCKWNSESATQLDINPAELSDYLSVINSSHPDATVILVREDIELPEHWLPRIQAVADADETNAVITPLGNCDPLLNPLPENTNADGSTDTQIYLTAKNRWFIDNRWPEGLAWVSAQAQATLIKHDANIQNAADILNLEGLQIAVCANLFALSKSRKAAKPLAVLGKTLQSLANWDNKISTSLSSPGFDQKPVLLHLSHNWGGGIDRWISDFCATDNKHHQLILEARAVTDEQEKNLALYLCHQEGRLELNSWCLQPAIEASAIEHPQYAKILQYIITAYQVEQLLISSLIGHALDALRCDLPRLQIIHDFYPLWPFLTEDPGQFIDIAGNIDFDQAWDKLQAKTGATLPGKHGLAYWTALRNQYLSLLNEHSIRIAPSQSALEMLQLLEGNNNSNIEQIPHGIDTHKLHQSTTATRINSKLRLLVPGRIHTGKGKQLLLEAIPVLTQIADIYLLGSGKDGEDFFGLSGVHVIYQYQASELEMEVSRISPNAALLLSTVPETWSYTLSEMHALGIPTITTKLGAFNERISNGKNGWLIDADAESLIAKVKQLYAEPALLLAVVEHLKLQQVISLEDMLHSYQPHLISQKQTNINVLPEQTSLAALQDNSQALAATRLQNKIQRLTKQSESFKTDLKKRADWAQSIEAELDQTGLSLIAKTQELSVNQQLAGAEIQRLNTVILERTEWAQQLDLELTERTEWANTEISNWQSKSAQWEDLHKQKDDTLTQVLTSRSWWLTKPLRAMTRLGRNLKDVQAYNPVRWPYIFKRMHQSLAIRGLGGTLQRAQHHNEATEAPNTRAEIMSLEMAEQSHKINDAATISGIDFPLIEQPEVSIIIPLYNQYAYTQACLLSLKQSACKSPFEVILVDDCSSDETPELLHACSGITALRNERNLGFIGSCNHGADKARGKYLLFLNNDTKVTDHWLDNLVATFTEFPQAGIVGSRLVYPDGSLQESGGIIFEDASGWNYGRNANADDPRYQFAREVDYVSGAALMIPTLLFSEFNGFDNHYAPAYYEDTDLAFKCREAGYQVLVQPKSTVIHYEGITSGTDLSQGMKKFQLVNHKKFQQRWEKALKHQPKPITDSENLLAVRNAAEHYQQKKLLLIDACTPQPDHDSGSVRILNMMRIFRDLGYQITFFPDNRQWDGKYSEALQAIGVEVLYGDWIRNLAEFFHQRGAEFDAVLISRYYIAENYLSWVKKYMPEAKFIFDTVDLHYLREQRQAELEQDASLHRAAGRSRRAELNIINQADTTLVVSPLEQSLLSIDAPNARVDVVSNIHPLHGSRKAFTERKDMFFIGGYQHPPNVDSAIWLAEKIWPLIHAQLPEVKCYLLGSKAPPKVQSLSGDGLIFKGFVEKLEPWLDDCRLALAPLRFGAGVKGKVNMSMSFGQPVVASGIAVEGMHAENGREVLIADDAETFAAEVVRLYKDEALWNRLSENGLKNVDKHFSFTAARNNIVAMMQALDQ